MAKNYNRPREPLCTSGLPDTEKRCSYSKTEGHDGTGHADKDDGEKLSETVWESRMACDFQVARRRIESTGQRGKKGVGVAWPETQLRHPESTAERT